MKRLFKYGITLAVFATMLGTLAAYRHLNIKGGASVDTILLLIPDSADSADPQIQEWIDAAAEEGLHLEVVRDSSLLDPMFHFHAAGLIVPDQVHRTANDTLIGALQSYVRNGGNLMLVYDACTWDLNGFFPKYGSRLTSLAGVRYALYDEYRKNTMETNAIWSSSETMQDLGVPPGKFVPLDSRNQLKAWRAVSYGNGAHGQADTTRFALVRYLYGEVMYPSFRTSGQFDGKVLLQSGAGIAAGERKYGLGKVLFVNLPLGYLKLRTDGLLLHSFLRYFAVRMLQLPWLASVPDGTGGLIMNWHIDAQSALKPIEILAKGGIFDQGPFSAHMTAGPDVDVLQDGKGLNVEHNATAERWLKYFVAHGDSVGSHGGWIHNYFGANVSDTNEDSFRKYLELNRDSLEKITGRRMTEYSAPLGAHPDWVTRWLEKNGFVAYYYSGDTGMGPTRVYRDNGRVGESIWAFPILHLGIDASFEEMDFDGVPLSTVQGWLMNIADFTAREHTARLFYSHPFGAVRYMPALQEWLRHTASLSQEKQFRWYTMSGLADFLNTRSQAHWSLTRSGGTVLLQASHPKTLAHLTWMLPKSLYRKPAVVQGKAVVSTSGDLWIVTAGDCASLAVEFGAA
ncbi:MAG TPA: polysaccharide deacetylase family protein [Candidatus Angelobacter sp.]|nr:polysaccharide deacetylase family protein [Candidatus Angelobacter sp.]